MTAILLTLALLLAIPTLLIGTPLACTAWAEAGRDDGDLE